MKNRIILTLVSLFILTKVTAQKKYFTPFLGYGITVASNDKNMQNINTPNNDIQYYYPKFKASKLTPLTFGFRFEYEKNKNRFGIGMIFGDESGSSYFHSMLAQANSPLFNNSVFDVKGNYVGQFNYKINVNYNYLLKEFSHFRSRNKFLSLNVYTGINVFIMDVWNENSFEDMKEITFYDGTESWLIQPFSGLGAYTLDGNLIQTVSWESNLNRGWSLSFNLGLSFDWYVKNKRRFTSIIYYEQGTKNVSAAVNEVYYNNEYLGANAAFSRGSAIQFKLLFPIEILKKKEK